MKFSKNTKLYISTIVEYYAKFDSLSKSYILADDDLSDFVFSKIASLIYIDNPDFATESTGPDNDYYDRYMVPALLVYLKDITDKDAKIEFNNSWAKGTTQYAMNVIKKLLEEELEKYNHNEAA